MSDEPVTVVIPYSPRHTPERMLEEAKASVERQSVPAAPLVVNDFEERGPAWGRNVGIDRADTRYIAFLDADDIWEKDKLARQLNRMKQTDCGLCIEGTSMSTETFIRELFVGNIESLTSSILLDTDSASVRFEESLERYEDHLFLLEAADSAGVCCCPDLVTIRKQERGLSSRGGKELLVEQRKRFRELATQRVPETTAYLEVFDAKLTYDCGRAYHQRGKYREAIQLYFRSLRSDVRLKSTVALLLSVFALFSRPPKKLLR